MVDGWRGVAMINVSQFGASLLPVNRFIFEKCLTPLTAVDRKKQRNFMIDFLFDSKLEPFPSNFLK